MTETPHLDRLPAIGLRAPWMEQGWCGHLLQRAPGFVFLESWKSLYIRQSSFALALIFYHDLCPPKGGIN